MQDPSSSSSSSWNKPHVYSASQPSPSATVTASGAPSTAPSAVTAAVAVTAAAGAALQPTIHPRATLHSGTRAGATATAPAPVPAAPCLTSSHVRPNLNSNDDFNALHNHHHPKSSPDLLALATNSTPDGLSPSSPPPLSSLFRASPVADTVLPTGPAWRRDPFVTPASSSNNGGNININISSASNSSKVQNDGRVHIRGCSVHPGAHCLCSQSNNSNNNNNNNMDSMDGFAVMGQEQCIVSQAVKETTLRLTAVVPGQDSSVLSTGMMSPSNLGSLPKSPTSIASAESPSSSPSTSTTVSSTSPTTPSSTSFSPPLHPAAFSADSTLDPIISSPLSLETSSSSSSSSHRPIDQDSSKAASSGRSPIYLPHFFTGVRPLNIVQGSPPSGRRSSLDSGEPSSGESNTEAIHQATPPRLHIVVTDVKSINFRDISTVPTLTTFGSKRSKRKSSNRSNSSSHSSTALDPSSAQSTSSHSSPHRRKKAKRSASSGSKNPWNLCTSSCGCSESLNHPTDGLVPGRTAGDTHPSPMEPTGRLRTISESDVPVSDHSSPSSSTSSAHRFIHPLSTESNSSEGSTGTKPYSRHHHHHHHHHRHHRHSHHHHHHSSGVESSQVDGLNPSVGTLERQSIQPEHSPPSYRRSQEVSSLTLQDTQHGLESQAQKGLAPSIESEHRADRHRESSRRRRSHSRHKRHRSPHSQDMASAPSSNPHSGNHSSKRARNLSGVHTNGVSSEESRTVLHQEVSTWKSDSPSSRDSPSHGLASMPVDRVHRPDHPLSPPGSQLHSSNSNTPLTHEKANGLVQRPEPSIHPLDVAQAKDTRVQKVGRRGSLKSSSEISGESMHSSRHKHEPNHVGAIDRKAHSANQGASGVKTSVNPFSETLHDHSKSSKSTLVASGASTKHPNLTVVVPSPATSILPISRETLRELDLSEIFKNPQLRHDIVFDPHLQFRPNYDGERGLIKRWEADRFWREVEIELNTRKTAITTRREEASMMLSLAGLPMSHHASRLVQQQQQQKCPMPKAVLLPRLISELREILLSLLPDLSQAAPPASQDGAKAGQRPPPPANPERTLLCSTLDPELILQELDHGVLDVHGLFRFLGDSLKGHCAPMRDALVESMVNIVVDQDEIVRGIRMCFEILEWMKLDVANHHLRMLRPLLLDNSIEFEQKYFTEHLALGGSLVRTTEWFKTSWRQWGHVKESVLGKSKTPASLGRRSSLAPSATAMAAAATAGSLSTDSENDRASLQTLGVSSFNAKRRSSIVGVDIGENILDGVVNEGLLEMILKPHSSVGTMPETLELDHYRLLSFHNDLQDLTILCILLILFRQLAQNCWTQQDLVDLKKVVWLLLTDETTNFGANTNTGKKATTDGSIHTVKGVGSNSSANEKSGGSSGSSGGLSGGNITLSNGGSSGMKDIVIQIEFAARKARERASSGSATSTTAGAIGNLSQSRGASVSSEVSSPSPTSISGTPLSSTPSPASVQTPASATGSGATAGIRGIAALASSSKGLSTSDMNLLTAWLDNVLCRTSTMYTLVQKRLMIHFRRWLYLHSSASMLVLSASCASLASAMSMSAGSMSARSLKPDDKEKEQGAVKSKVDCQESKEKDTNMEGEGSKSGPSIEVTKAEVSNDNGDSQASETKEGAEAGASTAAAAVGTSTKSPPPPSTPSAPEIPPEEANRVAAEALADKLSFNSAEMEAHGLTGLEDEMVALLEKIRAVAEFNRKVYGGWYRDMVKQGRAESWLESLSS